MCGIAGAVNLARTAPRADLSHTVATMRDSMVHRGPDAAGIWSDPETVVLGHRRLAIVDLSDQGRQPMSYASGRYTITFNGEIYNFRELSAELESLGHRFSSSGDTQVLLAAVVQWGLEGALRRSVGMFAFAIWDAEEQVLHLARDRLGEKPLYVGVHNNVLYFASELRAFRGISAFPRRLNPEAVSGYLQFGYVPEPLALYEGVCKLPPGTVLSVPARRDRPLAVRSDGTIEGATPEAYWSCVHAAHEGLANPLSDVNAASEQLEALLRSGIRQQMLCDVPLGCFLSGGIDSSLVAALMQSEASGAIHTFTVRFDTPGFDESEHARSIANFLGSRHEEFVLSERDVVASIPGSIADLDEPTANASFFAVKQISRLARTRATVVLSGDGGDELFAGYNRYLLARKAWNRLAAFPGPLRRTLASAAGGLARQRISNAAAGLAASMGLGAQVSTRNMLEKFARMGRAGDFRECYDYVTSCWPRYQLNPSTRSRARFWEDLPKLSAMLLSDQLDYLPGDSLAKVDRASMAVSLETRLPLLDHRVVEFSWRVPEQMKIRDGRTKWLMRCVLDRVVPRELTDRPKMGFTVPIEAWLQGSLREWANDQLGSSSLRNALGECLTLSPKDLCIKRGELPVGGYPLFGLAALGGWLDKAR